MAFTYVRDVDPNRKQFAIAEIGSAIYLQFGLLTGESRLLFESIIGAGFIGFFSGNTEVARVEVVDRFSVNGIQLAEIPSALVLGRNYRVLSTQAQPGASGAGGNVGLRQGIVRFSVAANLDLNVRARLHFDYEIIDEFYDAFELEFYPDEADVNTERPIPEGDPRYPRDIVIVPPRPFVSPGEYFHSLYLTPTYTGDIYIRLKMVEGVGNTELYQLVDVDGNRLVDVDGNVIVVRDSTMYQLVDEDGNRLLDVDGNILVGFF